jgi:hypothetical protein
LLHLFVLWCYSDDNAFFALKVICHLFSQSSRIVTSLCNRSLYCSWPTSTTGQKQQLHPRSNYLQMTCLLYRTINNQIDSDLLQRDVTILEDWENKWQAFAKSRRMISTCESLSNFDAISWMDTMRWDSHDRFLPNPCCALVRIFFLSKWPITLLCTICSMTLHGRLSSTRLCGPDSMLSFILKAATDQLAPILTLLIVSPRISEGDQYGSKDACTIYKCSWEGQNCPQEDHIK